MIIGTVLADRYRIEGLLGRGGMGTVWRATDVRTHGPVVVKLVTREFASFPIAVTRFLREMRVLALAQSPHVVELLDRGVDAQLGPYVVMERLVGEDLEQHVQRVGPVALEQMANIARQIGNALAVIHELGFVHRDIKPSNVFLCPKADGTIQAKLLDFGAVMADIPLHGDGSRTTPGMLIGTLTRMSPEQIQGEAIDARTDIWAFALMVYEAVVGQPVIRSEWSMGEIVMRICGGTLSTPSLENPALPSSFDAWFERSTQLNPGDRYDSIREQVDALVALCQRVVPPRSVHQRVSMPAAPQIIEVTGPVRAFPFLTLRNARGSNTARGKSTWPAPARIVPRAPVGLLTLRPPSRWPSAR